MSSPIRNILLVGHRGASAFEPENTLRSFRKAVELGANAVEMDIRATKDGEIVVIHDPKVNRTTNGRGKVGNLVLSEIQALDAGQGEPIPTLRGVVRWAAGKTMLLVEFKEVGLEARAAAIFRGHPNIIAISFFQTVLEELRHLDPKIPTGLLFESRPRHLDEFLASCQALGIGWVMGKAGLVNGKLVDAAHAKGLKVLAWTLDKPKAIARKLALGVDGITSNRPDLFRGV
jgi:glycerophosphoryl diester phosphodiesterase